MELKNGLAVNNQNHLTISGCDCVELAEKYGTPLYVMNEEHIRLRARQLKEAMDRRCKGGRVMFAAKAFMNKAMCRIAYSEDLGIDVVSGGELYTALSAGIPANMIELHGNNKTEEEIELALENNIYRIIIDGADEISRIEKVALRTNKKNIPVAIRLRPGIDAHTYHAVQTANMDCKFGLSVANGEAMKAAQYLISSEIFDFKGIHCHIGSQIFETSPFAVLVKHFMDFALELREKTGYLIQDFNCGGGFGVWYVEGDEPKALSSYIDLIMDELERQCAGANYPVPFITIEPGRSVVGEAGTTLYTVGGKKIIPEVRTYVSVDGGMFDNPRCALYESKYTSLCANKMDQTHDITAAIAGKCCESGDIITWEGTLPASVAQGDILAILTTGAYNYSMASNYNRNGIPAVVLVNQGSAELIVRRQTYADMAQRDIVPERLLK
ncbi:MAG: diaminopimelate decarboxylase [Clostridiales bacterium]|nr:diaminopimelate decarboxylase [Clostridiales bacterium]